MRVKKDRSGGGGKEGRRAEGRITFCSIKSILSQSSDLFNGQIKY